MANPQRNSTDLTVGINGAVAAIDSDADFFVASGDDAVYLPECITKQSDKSELTNLVHSARYHMRALQTSAAKICSDMARAKELFGESHSKFFMQYALANFFPKGDNGQIASSMSRRRRVDDWVQKGRLINDYFDKTGNSDVDRFSGLTMAALNSLCKAPDEIVKQVLDNPQGVKAVEIDARVALTNESAAQVSQELAAVKQELLQVKADATTQISRYEASVAAMKERISTMDESLDISNRQLNDSGGQILSTRRELEAAQKELSRLKSGGAGASAVRAATQKVDKTAEEEKQLEANNKRLRAEAEALKSKLATMKDQVAVRESVVSTVQQLRDDVKMMMVKYPVALRMKMQQVDPKASIVLDEIAADLHALGDQLKPTSAVNPHGKVTPINGVALSAADVMDA